MIKAGLDRLKALIDILLIVTFAIFCVAITYNIGARMLDAPRQLWVMDVAQYAFIWMVFLGSAEAVRRGSHFTIDLLPTTERRWVNLSLAITCQVLTGAIVTILLIGGLRYLGTGLDRTSTASGLQLSWAYAAIPVTAAMMLVFVVEKIFEAISANRTAPPPA